MSQNENSLVPVTGLSNDTGLGMRIDVNALSASEKLELHQGILKTDKAMLYSTLPIYKSRDLIGQVFTIHDARLTTITEKEVEKPVVAFLLQLDNGELVTVTKSANSFNNTYVDYFDARRGIAEQPLAGMTFFEDSNYEKAGNKAVVLRKANIPEAIAKGKG